MDYDPTDNSYTPPSQPKTPPKPSAEEIERKNNLEEAQGWQKRAIVITCTNLLFVAPNLLFIVGALDFIEYFLYSPWALYLFDFIAPFIIVTSCIGAYYAVKVWGYSGQLMLAANLFTGISAITRLFSI